jgi:TetR/AcrR family transcriptional repressor of nem operon
MKTIETKHNILYVVKELIWQGNYNSVSVNTICKKSEINKGSFYHFFPSKETVVIKAIDDHWKQRQPILDQIFSIQKDPIQRLMDYCDFVLKKQYEMKEKKGFVCGCPYI